MPDCPLPHHSGHPTGWHHTEPTPSLVAHSPMKEPRLQMRLKKQLSGGRVPHLLRGQNRAALSSVTRLQGPPGTYSRMTPRPRPALSRPLLPSPDQWDVIQSAAGAGAVQAARLVVVPAESNGWAGEPKVPREEPHQGHPGAPTTQPQSPRHPPAAKAAQPAHG